MFLSFVLYQTGKKIRALIFHINYIVWISKWWDYRSVLSIFLV